MHVVGVWHASFRRFQIYAELTRRHGVYKSRLRVNAGDGPRWSTKRWPIGTPEAVALTGANRAVTDIAQEMSSGLRNRLEYVAIGGPRRIHPGWWMRNLNLEGVDG